MLNERLNVGYNLIQSQIKAVNGTQHQYGFARVPAILRDSDSDDRKIKILPGMSLDSDKWIDANITEIIEKSNGNLELFQSGKCTGTKSTKGGLDYVEFR